MEGMMPDLSCHMSRLSLRDGVVDMLSWMVWPGTIDACDLLNEVSFETHVLRSSDSFKVAASF